jgi:ATP synthase protein I
MQADQLDLNQHNQARKSARKFILAQLITTIVLSVTLLLYDITVAYSSLAGGLIATLANAWFALKVFRTRSKETPETVLATFYVGEIYKFVLTGAMFIIVFVLIRPLNVVALLGTYLIIHLTPAVVNVFSREPRYENVDHEKDKES